MVDKVIGDRCIFNAEQGLPTFPGHLISLPGFDGVSHLKFSIFVHVDYCLSHFCVFSLVRRLLTIDFFGSASSMGHVRQCPKF